MAGDLWTREQRLAAVEALARIPRGQLGLHLADLSRAVGRVVTADSLRAAFKFAGLNPPSAYMRDPYVDDAPSTPRSVGTADTDRPPRDPDGIEVLTPAAQAEQLRAHQAKLRADADAVDKRIAALSAAPTADRVAALTDAVKRGAVGFEALCDKLDVSPKALRDLVEQAQRGGASIEIDGDHVGKRPKADHHHDDESRILMPAPVAGRHMFAVASDIHVGSKHHLAAELEDFVDRAYKRGVRTMLCPGDLLDGVYKHSVWEQSHRGFDEQVREAARTLPRRPGMQWHFILGNHDQTFEDSCGLDVGRAIVEAFRSEGREDWTYHGSRGAYLRLAAHGERGVVVEMWHPAKGGAYALSYKMQNHIRDYAVGAKPDVLLVGHWHQQCYFVSRGVHAMSCGTWQGGRSSYGRSLGGSPSIGGWICEYGVTADGTVREFSPTWVAHYETETARDVMMCAPAIGEGRA